MEMEGSQWSIQMCQALGQVLKIGREKTNLVATLMELTF